jgi:hypothetical protein
MKNSVICGCSFSFPMQEGEQSQVPYGILVSKHLGYDPILLSKPGASNYHIAKQVEFSLNFKPELVIIGTTTPLRFDFPTDKLKQNPSLLDFNYEEYSNNTFTFSKGSIISRSLLWFENRLKEEKNFFLKKKYKDIIDFYANYIDFDLKKDQDRLMLLGSINKLIEKNINFFIIDFSDIFSYKNKAMFLSLFYKKLNEHFPHSDGIHFSQEGHNYISNLVLKKLAIDNESL